jgi:glucose-6-phosphate isomerase
MGARIDPKFASEAGIGYLGGRTVGDLVAAQAAAMPEALNAAGRPVRTIDLEALSASSLGALLMHFMLETILVARLIGIDPFDQPAVEAAKIITRERLGA